MCDLWLTTLAVRALWLALILTCSSVLIILKRLQIPKWPGKNYDIPVLINSFNYSNNTIIIVVISKLAGVGNGH